MANARTYNTLEDIQLRKEEIKEEINKNNQHISSLWFGLFTTQKADTRGEMITNIISNSITAFDTFMLVRKLMNRYGYVFFRKKNNNESRKKKKKFFF